MPDAEPPHPPPTREEIDRTQGLVLIDFGASWCPHCQALAPQLARLLSSHPQIRHIKVEDGPGQPLGRSFRVKLWPNLVFLRDGLPQIQLSRPTIDQVRIAIEAVTQEDPARTHSH